LDGLAAGAIAVWPVIAPLVGVVIGALIASRQQTRAHRFQLVEAKLQRLRTAFQPVLLTAWAFSDATSPLATQPQEEEDASRSAMISEAMTGLNQARAQLALEADASDLNDTFQELYAAYALHSITLADTRAGDIPPEGQRLSDKRKRVRELADKLRAEMREALDKLERNAP
jgi:hypothetical protein